MTPLASVIVPSFNHAAFVGEAVHSALATTIDIEVIVVDDGSTDGTADQVAAIADPRVRLVRQENRGAHEAFNRGVSLARGELVMFLNSDDAFVASRIERCCEVLQRHPEVALVGSWIELMDVAGQSLGVKRGWHNLPPWPQPRAGSRLTDLGDARLALLETNYLATSSNAVVRRQLFTDRGLRFQPLRYAHDWELFLAAAAHGQVELIAEPLVRYRVHPANTLAETHTAKSTSAPQSELQTGPGLMRFEILWLLARHAAPLLARHLADLTSGGEPTSATQVLRRDLERRLWHGLPRFGRPALLASLLWLRGSGAQPAAAFEALLQVGHPFRQAAVAALDRNG